jgi:cytochrome P450
MEKYFLSDLYKQSLAHREPDNLKLFGENYFFTNNEKLIDYILRGNASNYSSGNAADIAGEFFFANLLHSNEELSDITKKLVTPIFSEKVAESFLDLMIEETQNLSGDWVIAERRESVVNIELEFQRLALRIAVQIFISPQLEINVDPILDGLADIMEISDMNSHKKRKTKKKLARLLPFISLQTDRFDAAVEFFDGLANQLAEEYLRKNIDKGLLFERLFAAYEASEIEYNTVIEIIKKFLIVGFLPIAEALTWIFYSVDKIQGLRKKIETEVEEKTGEGPLTMANLREMKLLRSVVMESLRLYPPVGAFQKVAINSDEFEGISIPRNACILISPYTLQRKAELWQDPLTFKPERFLNTSEKNLGFIPFGGEEINSLSEDFAIFEIQAIAATLFKKLRIYYQLKTEPVFKATPVMLPKERMLALAVKRHNFEQESIQP